LYQSNQDSSEITDKGKRVEVIELGFPFGSKTDKEFDTTYSALEVDSDTDCCGYQKRIGEARHGKV
jgi:hypothetical protein